MKVILGLFTIISVTLMSCQKEEINDLIVQDALIIDAPVIDLPITLIKENITLDNKLENPYSVTNMRVAYHNIEPIMIEAGIEEDDITTTHYYIKFKPDNESELQAIKRRYINCEFYEYPLDYEISGVVSYHDPMLPDSIPTYQYASIDSISWNTINVPEDVDYEILERLFIPDEDLDIDDVVSVSSMSSNQCDRAMQALVNESMRLTGNSDEYSEPDDIMGSSNVWYPSGRITAYDDVIGAQIPLEGVKVRARRWFTTRYAITDADGYYQFSKGFVRPVNYAIVWDGDGWNIRDGQICQAYYNGPKQKGPWNLAIPHDNNKSIRYATIHRAVYRYKKGNIYGLTRINGNFTTNICYAHRSNNSGSYGDYNQEWGLGLFCDIRIFGKSENLEYRTIYEILCTTFHELGHAAHYTNNIGRYTVSKKVLLESWASFVGYYLTLKEYGELGKSSGPFTMKSIIGANHSMLLYYVPISGIDRQYWTPTINPPDYTPLFIDLYDRDNQRSVWIYEHPNHSPEGSYQFINDDVRLIPANILETFVFNSRKLSQIKTKLEDFCNANTDAENANYLLSTETINALFEHYEYFD